MLFLAFSLGGLLQAFVLFINALAVLNEERFLKKVGWSADAIGYDQNSVKSKLINLLKAIRTLLPIPLIGINSLIIVWKMIFG
mmetsp:Transcript_6942/g.10937  ORF Transcript_6942/g.10937 Transcript_6942/m.10937 type:complete len:83 (-) Transcript_6942:257-505(-)